MYHLHIDTHTIRIARLNKDGQRYTVATRHIKRSKTPLLTNNRLYATITLRSLLDQFIPVAQRKPRCLIISIPSLDEAIPHHPLLVQLIACLHGLAIRPYAVTTTPLFTTQKSTHTTHELKQLSCLIHEMRTQKAFWKNKIWWYALGVLMAALPAIFLFYTRYQHPIVAPATKIVTPPPAPKVLHPWPLYRLCTAIPRGLQLMSCKKTVRTLTLKVSSTNPTILDRALRQLTHALPGNTVTHSHYRFCYGMPPLYLTTIKIGQK